ncbi:MAG TPA: GAF domain-containing protein, partial [Casimicrobiaceae bacterium]
MAIAAVSYGSIHALQDRARWVEHTFEVRTQFDEMLAEYRKARIAWRGYLADGADANLREFTAAVGALPQRLQATRRLIADNPAQQARLAAIERLLDVDVAALAVDVQAKREGKLAREEDTLKQMTTARFNIAELEALGREFRDEETRLLAVREQEATTSAHTTTAAIIVGNVAGFVVLLCAFWMLKRQNERRARLEQALQQANRELESRVEQRTGELERANADLAALNATLEQRDERFRSVAEASQEWIWDTDAHGIHTYCNSAVAAILGRSPEQMVGESALDHIHQDDLPAAIALRKNAAAEKRGWRKLVLRWRHQDGSFRWLESNALPLLGLDGEVIGHRGADRDITDRIEQQEKIARLSRIHAMFSGISSTIVHIRDRQELFREACRIAVADGKFSMAWVGVVDPGNADGSVVATAGVEEGYKAKIRLTSRAGLPHSERPACRALREKMPVICNDIATDPAMVPLRDDALARGYRSVAAFPLLLGGEAHAVLVLYAAHPDFFDEDELKLLKELAADLTFALDH